MAKRRGKIDSFFDEEINSTSAPPLVKGGNDFDYCVKTFLDELDLKNLSFHTKRWHKENLHYVRQTLEKLNLPVEPVKITERDLKQCILYWKRECQLSPTTINHRIRSLKQIFDFLNKEGFVNSVPAGSLDKLKAPKVIIKPFEEEELRKLFTIPDKSTFVGFRDYTIMLVLLDTGVRLIELENMKTTDIDLKNNMILVFGKGAKEREVIFQNTTKEHLRRYLLIRGQLDHDYLWISDAGARMQRRNIEFRLRHYGEMAGLDKVRVSPHTFRHYVESQVMGSGHPKMPFLGLFL